jgi:hypothetical protein
MLNKDAFELLAGEPDFWDDELRTLCDEGVDLVKVQVDQHARGRRSAELTKTIHGWSVRAASGLDDFRLLFGSRIAGHEVSREEAVAWGTAWANADPTKKEFYVRRDRPATC